MVVRRIYLHILYIIQRGHPGAPGRRRGKGEENGERKCIKRMSGGGCVPGELPGWESTTKVNDTYQSLMARLIIYQSDIKYLSIIYTNTIYIHRELLYTIDMSTEGGREVGHQWVYS